MTTTKTITLSMESLNRLYFQFLDKFVTPNLAKTVTEIAQLMRNKTAYDVHKYLEELMKPVENNEKSCSPNSITNNLNSSTNSYSNGSGSLYQYALPTHGENSKNSYLDQLNHSEKKSDKPNEESIHFKNKGTVRRAMTGLAFEQPPKLYEFKPHSQTDDPSSPSIYTTPLQTTTDYKFEFNPNKDTLSYIPILTTTISKTDHILQQSEKDKKMLKEIVRKIGKVFNENHSKIQKYNKGNDANKLFNLNTSTRIEKKEESMVKQYKFHTKTDYQIRKY